MKGLSLAVSAVLVFAAVNFTALDVRAQAANTITNYTEKEYGGMFICVAMTDTAWTTALQKLKGVSLADEKKLYEPVPNGPAKDMHLKIVDKVYGDSFATAWDYAVSFFGECAENMANVPKDRTRLAGFCMQNAMIGMTAWEGKNSATPTPIEKVYEHFKAVDRSTPRAIIDRVYASSKSRSDVGLDEWKSCMDPLVAKPTLTPPPVKPIPPQGGLTDPEFAKVASCVSVADTLEYDADQKLKGVSLADVKKTYDSYPDDKKKTLALQIADKAYADTFTAPGLYAMKFLDGCALKNANVEPARMGVANSCLSRGYIASIADIRKKSGVTADKAYEPYAEIYGTMASTIIDKVYRAPASGEDAGVAEWKACVISSPTWTEDHKADEVLVAPTPAGFQIGAQVKTQDMIAKHLFPQGEAVEKWTEKLSFEILPGFNDHTPTQFQKAIQAPSKTCPDGKVISSSVGQENGYAYSLWSETCPPTAPAEKTEFRFNKAIQGHEQLYLVIKSFQFEPSKAQIDQVGTYLNSVKVCDSKRSGGPCPTLDVWHP